MKKWWIDNYFLFQFSGQRSLEENYKKQKKKAILDQGSVEKYLKKSQFSVRRLSRRSFKFPSIFSKQINEFPFRGCWKKYRWDNFLKYPRLLSRSYISIKNPIEKKKKKIFAKKSGSMKNILKIMIFGLGVV